MNSIIVTLEKDGTENTGYEINNTEFVSAWDVKASEEASADTKAMPANAKAPSTGDQAMLAIILVLLALALMSAPIVIQSAKRAREK